MHLHSLLRPQSISSRLPQLHEELKEQEEEEHRGSQSRDPEEEDEEEGTNEPINKSKKAPKMNPCVPLSLAIKNQPSISCSQTQSLTPRASNISSIDTRKSLSGSVDSMATATPPLNAAAPPLLPAAEAPHLASTSVELLPPASGSKKRRLELSPRMTASSSSSIFNEVEKHGSIDELALKEWVFGWRRQEGHGPGEGEEVEKGPGSLEEDEKSREVKGSFLPILVVVAYFLG